MRILLAFLLLTPASLYAKDYVSLICATVGVSLVGRVPTPTPSPTPDDSKCSNCQGRGKLGDGTIVTICPVCNGTGKASTVFPQPDASPGDSATLQESPGIEINGLFWFSNFDIALEHSKETGKPLLLVCSLERNCRFCEILKGWHNTSPDPLQSFVLCRIHQADYAKAKWNVRSFPTQIVFVGGKERKRMAGLSFAKKEDYCFALRSILEERRE